MYQYLSGHLAEKTPEAVVLDVGGVGYWVQIPASTQASLPEIGAPLHLWIHFTVREDAHTLYGFAAEEERRVFRRLITVSGIGPKMAMQVLSGTSLPDFRRAVIENDIAVLTGISGVGRKTAERMVVELREKLLIEEKSSGTSKASKLQSTQLVEDSLRALMELGYRRHNAKEAVDKAIKNFEGQCSVSDLVKTSLKYI